MRHRCASRPSTRVRGLALALRRTLSLCWPHMSHFGLGGDFVTTIAHAREAFLTKSDTETA
jgi:hypothetical protein